jgi:integrase/recombinase XerD
MLLFIESGIRRAALAALDITDIDLRARAVTVRRGKGGKSRMSVFGTETAFAILRMLRHHPTREGALFVTSAGHRLTVSAIGYMMRRRGTQAGVEGLRPHLVRHAWTYVNLANGIQEHEIMDLAGWSSSQQIGRYGAALASQLASAAGRAVALASLVMAS